MASLLDAAILQALRPDPDEDAYWLAIRAVQRHASQEIFDSVVELSTRPEPALRSLVPDVLRFLGGRARPFRAPTVALLGRMLSTEMDPGVVADVGMANVDLHSQGLARGMLDFQFHPDARVRHAVVLAALGWRDRRAVTALIRLASDQDPEVRHWATFGLGSQLGDPADPDGMVDSPELRQVLWQRAEDTRPETRAEAVVGLALRRDPRVRALLEEALEGTGPEWSHYVEAASRLGDPALLPFLEKLQEQGWGQRSAHLRQELELAIATLARP